MLRQGDVGVSLAESEASIAAPFTYARPNISCIPMLLAEGRSSLMTSFQLFRYMAMYSMIQFTSVILCYFVGTVLGNWQYLLQDMFFVFPLTVFIGSIGANRKLSVKRPSGNLLSLTNVMNVLTHMLFCFFFQLIVFELCKDQTDYIAYQDAAGFDNGPRTYQATSLYYFSNFQYVLLACLFAMGKPWKQPVYKNLRFTVWAILCSILAVAVLFANSQRGFFEDEVPISSSWRGVIFMLVLVNVLVSSCWELLFFPALLAEYKGWKKRRGGQMGKVYGRMKKITGQGVKEWHRLRAEFEENWEKQ